MYDVHENLLAGLSWGPVPLDHRPVNGFIHLLKEGKRQRHLGKNGRVMCWGTERNKEIKKQTKKQRNLVKIKSPCFALA